MTRKAQDNKLSPSSSDNFFWKRLFVNMVLVVMTINKAHEEEAFNEREPLKGKGPQDWNQEEDFKQLMVDVIKELHTFKRN